MEFVIINIIFEVFDVEVDVLVFVSFFLVSSFIRFVEFFFVFVFFLGMVDI